MSISTTLWAMSAQGLTPAAKLVLILVGDACDMDGAVFDLDALAAQANITPEYLVELQGELARAGLAVGRTRTNPRTGAAEACIELLCGEEVLG